MDDLMFNVTNVTKLNEDKVEKEKRPSLFEDDLEILSYIEQFYWENGFLPSNQVVSNKIELEEIRIAKSWLKPEFRNALVARGIELAERKHEGVLSPKQIVLVNMLLNVGDKTSLRQKLEAIQVTQGAYNAWLRDPVFQSYLRMRTEQLFEFADHDAYKALIQAVTDGDVPAMKLFFEMRGIYNPKLTVDVNIETVVLRVVEIVAKHVKDPTIIEAIARDVETLEIGARSRAIA